MPLLLNPAEEDPWDSLFFESKTGMIAARYEAAIEAFSPRGAHTIDPKVLPLNIEAVTEARLRTTRNLRRAVSSLLKSFDYANPAADEEGQTNLLQAIRDNDSYGLAVWFFIRDGREESPFDDLRRNHGELWARVGELLNG